MFRFPIEEKEKMFENRFMQVIVAAMRARELRRGNPPKIISRNGAAVTALKEIELGHIGVEYLDKVR